MGLRAQQHLLFPDAGLSRKSRCVNKVQSNDLPVHDWYRFVLSFPPHLVRDYLDRFGLQTGQTLLDPFCGTGTTLIEGQKTGLRSIGIDANRMAYFACSVKCNWNVNTAEFMSDSLRIATLASQSLRSRVRELEFSPDEESLILKDSITPELLHKTLVLRDTILRISSEFRDLQLLALATTTIRYCSRLHFGPEIGVSYKKKYQTDVLGCWKNMIQIMEHDLNAIPAACRIATSHVILDDARTMSPLLKKESIDAVFTSPPYPNEKDYTRATRLESVLLGFVANKQELRKMKENLLRSNSRNIYKGDADDRFVAHHAPIMQVAEEIEHKRQLLGKTSGFEKQYHRIVRQYFGGLARHLQSLKPYLKKNAQLGYVVGDQASFLQVHIPTGRFLADIATDLGYTVESIDLFRTRFATPTGKHLKEEVVVLKWKG